MISGTSPEHLHNEMSFHLSRQGLRYLGTDLTFNSIQLSDDNYNNLFTQTKKKYVP